MTMSQADRDRERSKRSSHSPVQPPHEACVKAPCDLPRSSHRALEYFRDSEKLTNQGRIIISAIDICFKNWYEPWKKTFLDNGSEFNTVSDLMERLLHYENQILNSDASLNPDRRKTIALAIMRLIDFGNAILNIDIVLWTDDDTFREIDPTNMTIIELLKAHIKAQSRRDELLFHVHFKASGSNINRYYAEGSSPTQHSASFQQQKPLSPPSLRISSSNLSSPEMDRSKRFSIGSNSSINTLVPSSTNLDGRRTPRHLSPADIEVKKLSSTEDLTEGRSEMRKIIETLKSTELFVAASTDVRIPFLQATIENIMSFLSLPATTDKLANGFELLEAMLNSVERIPPECRIEEVSLIAGSLLKTLVKRVYIDDMDSCIEFQRTRWTTYLLGVIRLMSASEFDTYLKSLPSVTDRSAFLNDYLFIVKRLISQPKSNESTNNVRPVYPRGWVEMSLLISSTMLASLTNLYKILKQHFNSNVQMWFRYLDCLLHFISQDIMKPGRPMLKEQQTLRAIDLRRTCADYVWITWHSLSGIQKSQLLADIIEPLIRVCIQLSPDHRSILLPIFYDLMQCDYTAQYVSPRSTVSSTKTVVNVPESTGEFLNSQINYLYAEAGELARRTPPLVSVEQTIDTEESADGADDQLQLMTMKYPNTSMTRINADETLPYLGVSRSEVDFSPPPPPAPMSTLRNTTTTGSSDDGTVLTEFTHLMICKLNTLMMESNLGDEQFKEELCSAIRGEFKLNPNSRYNLNHAMHATLQVNQTELSQFKSMAKHTANLVAEFIQICLDSRQATQLSYNHLYLLCLFKLILFFRDKVDRPELYLSNLYKLWSLHHKAQRFIESGFTLLELAKSLTWSDRVLEDHYRILTRHLQTNEALESHMCLKQHLYTTIIQYFDEGLLWEAAVPLCRELIDIYQFKLFDYEKVAQLHSKLADFFNNITNGSQLKSRPEYFRVAFYGVGFPECLRDTTMIYRGRPFEMLCNFQATLMSKYPDAELLKSLDQPDESLISAPKAKYLQITACKPVVNFKAKLAKCSTSEDGSVVGCLPSYIVDYYKFNECDKFEFSRRMSANDWNRLLVNTAHNERGFRDGAAKGLPAVTQSIHHNHERVVCTRKEAPTRLGSDDFARIWRQQITMTTNNLPGILPFFTVYLQETNIVSPIECAIEDLGRANDELSSMVSRFKADKRHELDARSLGRRIQGMVDAAVNGGISVYEEAFFHVVSSRGSKAPRDIHSNDLTQVPLRGDDPADAALANDMASLSVTSARAEKQPQQYVARNNTSPRGNTTRARHNEAVDKSWSSKMEMGHAEGHQCKCCDCMIEQAQSSAVPTTSQTERLKSLIAAQVPLLDEAIRLHAARVDEEMRPHHMYLESSYNRLRHHIMSKYARYLPNDFTRVGSLSLASSASSTLRSYRSLGRSPNRSLRSESRLFATLDPRTTTSDGLMENVNHSTAKRGSDVGVRSVASRVSFGHRYEQMSGSNEESPYFTYEQLHNERRSLPFLTGLVTVAAHANGCKSSDRKTAGVGNEEKKGENPGTRRDFNPPNLALVTTNEQPASVQKISTPSLAPVPGDSPRLIKRHDNGSNYIFASELHNEEPNMIMKDSRIPSKARPTRASIKQSLYSQLMCEPVEREAYDEGQILIDNDAFDDQMNNYYNHISSAINSSTLVPTNQSAGGQNKLSSAVQTNRNDDDEREAEESLVSL